MKAISICHQKGGVGKTTSTINIGACLAKMGNKVLILDMDPQGSLSKNFGFYGEDKETYKFQKSMYDILRETETIEDTALGVDFGENFFGKDGALYVIPAGFDLSKAHTQLITETLGKQLSGDSYTEPDKILKKAFENEADALSSIDYILIDCPTSLTLLTTNALLASDGLIIPIVPEADPYDALIGFFPFLNSTVKKNSKLEIVGIINTIVEPNTTVHKKYMQMIKEFDKEPYNIPILGMVPKTAKIKQVADAGVPMVLAYPGDLASLEYYKIAERLTKHYS